MSEKIPVAVIGVGEHGRKHARQFKEVEGAHWWASTTCARSAPGRWPPNSACGRSRAWTRRWAPCAAVSVVIPTTDHAAVARQAFDRGVDVLLEKPITRTVEEADELIARAAARGAHPPGRPPGALQPGVVAAKAVTRGPLFFEIHRLGVFSPRSLDVDVVFDLMIHDLDLVLWMVNAPVRDVRAVGLPVLSDKVDIANARVEFENGAVANLTASRVSTERVRKFRYFQPYEYFSIDFYAARRVGAERGPRRRRRPASAFASWRRNPRNPCGPSWRRLLSRSARGVPPLVGGPEGREALALAERVMNCIEEHAALVNVPLGRPVGRSGEL